MQFTVDIDPSLKNIVKLGFIQFDDVEVLAQSPGVSKEIDELAVDLQKKYPTPHEALDRLNITRSFFRTIGLDPTKNRPSSEALLRRVLNGKSIYQINSVVDICNLCSLSFLLSIGLYDVDKLKGSVHLRLGKQEEGYPGIGKEFVNLNGRLALFDDIGPFGNPSSDSARTKISQDTRNVVFIVFCPASDFTPDLERHLNFIEEKMVKYHSCRIVKRGVI